MTTPKTLKTLKAITIYDLINTADKAQLDTLARELWRLFGRHQIDENDAEILQSSIDQRRTHSCSAINIHNSGKTSADLIRTRMESRFYPRQRPRSPDLKASRDRRRMFGGSSGLPSSLRHNYTEGQRAVLCIIAGEIKRNGLCDLCVDKIGALAGVCRTTVQTTLHEARRLGHIKITERPIYGRKHLTNLVEIISPKWIAWIKRATNRRPVGSNPPNLVSTTKT